MIDITHQIARFACEIRPGSLPDAVGERTRALVMDQFGIALRARHEAAIVDATLAALGDLGLARGEATVVGDSRRYPPATAAFLNANLGHALDFDDTHARGSIHPSAPIVWAAIAAGEMTGASGADLVAAVTAGYEIQIRLSLALVPARHYRRGFHPTATCGVFGAAAAAGRLLGLTVEQMESAFGLCGSQAAGSMQYIVNGSWNKPFHVGAAAMNGLTAAAFARHGYLGSAEPIEGPAGFLNAYGEGPEPEAAVAGLGEVWETLHIAVKPYPSCRYGHAAMDALIALREEHALRPDDVEAVEIGLPETGWRIIGDSDAEKQAPRSVVDGQFSMPFVAAVALREGGMDWDSYARNLGDPETLALCRRVTSVVDPAAEAEFPAYMAGVARVRTTDGRTLERKVTVARGEPENFPGPAELRAKFDGLVAGYLPPEGRDALADALTGLDRIADLRQVMALVRPDSYAAAPGSRTPAAAAAGGD